MSENAGPPMTLTVLFAHMTRYFMVADLTKLAFPPIVLNDVRGYSHSCGEFVAAVWRPIMGQDADAEMLARLMLDAYRGTIDDQGETINDARSEVGKLLRNEYGILDRDASIVLYASSLTFASATIITRQRGTPLLAFSMTAPGFRRKGYARAGLMHVMNLLAKQGEKTLRLLVTKGNTPAETLYTSLGFVAESA